jgi:hypothetical protein
VAIIFIKILARMALLSIISWPLDGGRDWFCLRFWLFVSVVIEFALLAFLFLSWSSSFVINNSFIFIVSNYSSAKAGVKREGFIFCYCLLVFLVTLDCVVLSPNVVFSGFFSFCF